MDELEALWYHLEDLCDEVSAPHCGYCGKAMDLVPPEMLYYSCREDFPRDFEFKYVTKEDSD